MNKFDPTKTKELQKEMLKKFETQFSYCNIFKKQETENKIKFKKYAVVIPWYLKPFSKTITNIAYSSFKDGLSENCTDTVTIKRPNEYKSNE